MATSTQLNSRMEAAVSKAERTQESYLKVLSSEGTQDIKLSDGTFTPNLNKRLVELVTRVKSVVGKTGDVTAQEIKDSLNLRSAADYNAESLPLSNASKKAIQDLNLGSASRYDVENLPVSADQANINAGKVDFVDSIADLPTNAKDGQVVFVNGYYKVTNFALSQPYSGGGNRVYIDSRKSENDGFLCINGWVLIVENNTVNPEQAGAMVNNKDFDNSIALQKTFDSGFEVVCLDGTYYTKKPVYHKSGFKLRGQGFWNQTRIYKTTNDLGDLPDVLSPDGTNHVSYKKDAVLIAIPDSGGYCHDVEISNILIGREWIESDQTFQTGYSYFAPYLAQSEFNSVWCNATRYTWYVVNQWMCTFNRCEGSGGEWVVGGLDGDLVRGGTTSTYNSCWSKVIHIANANAWTFTDMTTVTMNSCGTDGLGLVSSVGGAVIKAKNSGITLNGFGVEVTHSENIFDFDNCAVNIKALHFYQVFNNHSRIFNITGGVVTLDCSILDMVYKDTSVSVPDFAIISNGGSFDIKNVTCDPPFYGLSNSYQNKNAVVVAANSHGLIESNGSRQEWSEGDGVDKTNRALQITNNTEDVGVFGSNAIHYASNSFQLGNARLFRDGSGLLRQTRNSKPVDQYDGVPVGGIPIYPDGTLAKAIEGNVYFDSTTKNLMIYSGEAWFSVAST